jgi:hypothetical protein
LPGLGVFVLNGETFETKSIAFCAFPNAFQKRDLLTVGSVFGTADRFFAASFGSIYPSGDWHLRA